MSTAATNAQSESTLKDLNPEKLERAMDQLKVLSHPQRIAIVDLLSRNESRLTVTEIYRQLGMSQAIASAHLVTLKNRGILESKKNGTSVYYTVRSPFYATIIACLQASIAA